MDSSSRKRKYFDFFNQECKILAKELLGQLLVRVVDGIRVSSYIVETECYLGLEDAASHSYRGKRTTRNEPMFMSPGTAYVYFIYGMYNCFNISSKEEGSCVLVRALEPLEGLEQMQQNRQRKRKVVKNLKDHMLCNGPSKLCMALDISKDNCNKADLCSSTRLWVEDGARVATEDVVISKRIGIESAGPEWANKPLRFYCRGNNSVSSRDKVAESLMTSATIFP